MVSVQVPCRTRLRTCKAGRPGDGMDNEVAE